MYNRKDEKEVTKEDIVESLGNQIIYTLVGGIIILFLPAEGYQPLLMHISGCFLLAFFLTMPFTVWFAATIGRPLMYIIDIIFGASDFAMALYWIISFIFSIWLGGEIGHYINYGCFINY